MNVNKRIEKRDEIGMVTNAASPLVTIKTAINSDVININDIITPASVAVVFMKSAMSNRY